MFAGVRNPSVAFMAYHDGEKKTECTQDHDAGGRATTVHIRCTPSCFVLIVAENILAFKTDSERAMF